ncbi:MAG TPA: hypothetical protein VIO81_04600 [Methyloversatilis sp.]
MLLSAGTFGGSGAVTFTGAGSTWTGGDVGGTGSSILAAGATLSYSAGTRTTARRLDIQQGATFSLDSGVLTATGGATNAGVINVATGTTARYGGSASYLLDSTGQFDGGGRIEFIDSAVVTSSTTAPLIADSTFTVRAQDSARFTMTTPTSIANLEVAGNAVVTAQGAFGSQNVSLTGGTLTLNGGSQIGNLTFSGGTFTGTGTGQTTLTGTGLWSRGVFAGKLRVASGASLTISGSGSDDSAGSVHKQFGAGTLTNDGTMTWTSGNINVIGAGSVVNNGVFTVDGGYDFGDLWVGDGIFSMLNSASGLIVKTSASGATTSFGSLGIPGGTANYVNFINNGAIDVQGGTLRFNVGYNGATGGGSVTHNGTLHIAQNSTFEVGTVGTFAHNGTTAMDANGTLRHVGGFTNAATGVISGLGTIDIGTGSTLRNDGQMLLGTDTHGTLTINGNFVQGAGGTLTTRVGGAATGQFDSLAVRGSATLNGRLVVVEDAGFSRDAAITIDVVTAAGALSGSFTSVMLPAEGYALAQTTNAVRLNYAAIVCGGICWDGGAGTTLWTDAANWTGNALPGLNDLVFINLAGGGQVLLTGGDQRIASLTTGAGSTLTIAGGALTLTGQSGTSSGLASTLAGNVTLTGGTLTVAGPATFADLRQSGGFSQFDGSVTVNRLTLSGGEGVTLRTNGSLTVTDNFDWRDQTDLDGAGTFTTAGLTAVTGSGGLGFGISVDWHNSGTVQLVNGALLHFYSTSDGNGGALINEAGGVIDLSGGNALALGTHSGPLSRFVNAGTLIKGSGGDQKLEGNYTFDNLGTVQVDGGRLDIRVSNADGGTDTGRYISNATLAFGAGQRQLAAGSDVTGSGTVEFSGARVTVDGSYGIAGTGSTRIAAGRADFASALTFANTLTVRGGVLNFNGNTRLNRLDMGWSGGDPATYSIIGGTGALTFTGGASTVTDGTLASGIVSGYDTTSGPLYVQVPTAPRTVTVASNASLTLGGDNYADLSGIALDNQGTLALVRNIHIHLDNTLDNAGTLQIGTATTALNQVADVAWTAPGSLAIHNTGTLTKQLDGSALLVASLNNSGTTDVYAGTLQLGGDYVQGANATLVTRLGYGTAGRLQAGGTAALAGVLQVVEAPGYNRASLDANIVSADGGLIGRFDTQRLPADYTIATSATGLNLRYSLISCGGICWDGGAGTSNWFDRTNWTGDALPGLNDLVFIDLAGGANVVLNAAPPVTVAGLTIGNANSLTLTGGILNTRNTTVRSGGTLSLSGGTLNFGSSLLSNGTINYDGGSLGGTLFTNNGRLNVLPGSSGNLTTTRLNNNGSIVVDASDGTFEFGSGGGMILANNGSVAVSNGTLSVLAHDTDASGPGADSGAWSVDSGATLRFRDAFRDFGPTSSVTGAGDVEFTAFSGGAFNVNGAYNVTGNTRITGNTLVNFNHSATFGQLDIAGNVGGVGTLNVLDGLNWTAGTVSGAGRSVVVGDWAHLNGDNLVLDGARLTLINSGQLGAGTQVAMNGNAQIIVSDSGTLGLGSNSAIVGSGSLVNRGTLEGTIGGGSSNVGVLLSNLNVVKASNGSLGLTGGIANTGSGSFVIGADATMELGGDLPPDIFDRIGGAGTLSFSPTSIPVINRTFSAQGGSPFSFSLRSGAVLSGAPLNGSIDGQAAGWIYTANTGYNGADNARFTLSLGSGTAVFNIRFNVSSPSLVPPQVVLDRVIPPEVVKPPPPIPPVPRIERPSAPTVLASVDELSDIVTASGSQIEQPLRDFRASRLQCR